jgi:mevalonate kinase
MITASAPGKIILFGEHAVVYGQPALAAPVTQVRATATVRPSPAGESAASLMPGGEGEIWIDARDLRRHYRLSQAAPHDPLAAAIRLTLNHFARRTTDHAFALTLTSTIPPASGLGSGAAVCTAIVRALAAYLHSFGFAQDKSPISDSEVSAIVFETEKLLHGTPSGIDNTVIAYEQPVYFIKGQPPAPFTVGQPFTLLIADTGIPSPTKITVGDVRAGYEREPERFGRLFAEVGRIVNQAREIIAHADPAQLGPLLARNHALLQEMGVSSRELDALAEAATGAGALGAKLSGGGRGGNLIALVTPATTTRVEEALRAAGAVRVMKTTVDRRPPTAPEP